MVGAEAGAAVVPQTSKSAVSQVSKPASRAIFGRATQFHALPIWKSAIRQVWKPALRVRRARDLLKGKSFMA